MINRKSKRIVLKFFSLFSVVRGYNILVIVLAQYLASIYILAPDLPVYQVIFNSHLFIIVLVSAMVIASGYIINNFYDSEKDLINKPKKSMLDRLVSQQTKLTTYFVLNFVAVLFASYVSFKAVLFFSSYIFGIWYYSHRLKKIPLLGNFVSATLAIAPFFVVFVYYKNFETVIFVHAIFLFLLILAKEMIKDLENIAGDLAQNYKTMPVLYGAKLSKVFVTVLVSFCLVPSLLLIYNFDVGYMHFYFKLAVLLLVVFIFLLWQSKTKRQYNTLHNILKLIIIAGVFSILLIDVDLVLNRIL